MVLRKDEKWIMFIILKNYGFILLKFTTLWSWLSQLNLLLFPFPTSNILLHILKYIEERKKNKAEAQVAGDGIDCPAVKYMGFMPTWVRAQAEKQSQCKIHIKRCAARNWLMQLGGLVKKSKICRVSHQEGQAGTELKVLSTGGVPSPLGKTELCY